MSDSTHLPPSALDDWLAAAAEELGIDPGAVPVGAVLDIARDVAHGVARPAAPLTTFLVGMALGAASERDDRAVDFEELASRVTRLAEGWGGES